MSWTTADICDEHGDAVRVLEPRFHHLGATDRFCGPAATVLALEDNSLVREALGEAGEGRILVVDGGGSLRCALVGDRLATLAVANGWTGIVVWGAVRDTAVLKTLDIGVAALATHPRRSVKRDTGERGVPVRIAGVTIAPGDWLYADGDGIVVTGKRVHP